MYIYMHIHIYMRSIERHDKILNNVYYDPPGYVSITSTFKEAVKQENTITLNMVKQWFKSNLELLNKSTVATHS